MTYDIFTEVNKRIVESLRKKVERDIMGVDRYSEYGLTFIERGHGYEVKRDSSVVGIITRRGFIPSAFCDALSRSDLGAINQYIGLNEDRMASTSNLARDLINILEPYLEA